MGDSVFVMILTYGECGKHPSDREECLGSIKILVIKDSNIVFGSFPKGYLSHNREIVAFVENHISVLNVDKVYTHDPTDRHQNHKPCSYVAASAA